MNGLDEYDLRRAFAGWRRPPILPVMRMGLPETGGTLVKAALHWPVLVSAGAMWDPKRHLFIGPAPGLREIADVALDSAGFTAQTHHGGYPWTPAQYVELAVLHPPHRAGPPIHWAWWAQMDLCCEPEIAHDRDAVRARVDGTAALLVAWRRPRAGPTRAR